MSITGTYVYRDGKIVKISSYTPSIKKIPDWAKRMDPVGEQKRVFNNMTSQEFSKEQASK